MNIRLQKYKKNRIAGMSQYNAAMAAGYSKSTAGKACRLEKKLDDLSSYLERAGLTNAKLAKSLAEAIDTIDVVMVKGHYYKGVDGERQLLIRLLKRPDWKTRLKAIEMITQLKGDLTTKLNVSGHVTFTKMGDVTVTRPGKIAEILSFDIGN